MPITFLDEEEDITPLAPPTKRKITFLDEEDDIAPATPQATQPAVTQPSQYKYDPARFRPKGLVAPKAEQEVGTLEGIANAARNAFDSSRQALDIVGDVTPEEAKNIAKIEFDKQSRKIAPGYDEYQKAEGFDAVLAFAKNPIEVTSNIVAEGLAGSLPALGAGLAAGGVGAAIGAPTVIGAPIGFTAGQVAGTFAGSLATEYGSKILEEMQEGGVDLTKPESIQGFFENEEAVAAARDKAISRGIPVAAFDAISAGIGGKLGRVIGKQFLTKTGEAAAELGVQAGLGGGGEVAGALAAGEPIEGKAVFGEVIGEAGPGAAEIITGRMADRAARVKAEEDAKIKAAAQLSDNLEQNSAPLTAAVVKSTTATTIEQDKLAAQLEEQLDADEIEKRVIGQLAVTKKPTAVAQKPMSKDEFKAIYSQVAPEELDAAEAGFTEQAVTDATEEGRISAQNALEAIKEVKATVTPPAPPVEPAITPAVTPAVPTAQPTITDATQEIIQPEGVRQEPQDGTQVQPTEETGVGDSILGAARGEEEGQVVPTTEPIISEIPATSELVGAEPTQPTIREVPEISPIVGAEPAAIVEQEPVAPTAEAPIPVTTPPVTEAVTPAEAPAITPAPVAETPAVTEAPTAEVAPAPITKPAQEDVKVSRYRKFLGESAPQAISEAKNALSTFKTTMLGKRGDSPFQAEPRLRELKNVISLFVANRLNVTNQNADQIAEQIILGKPNIVDKVTELKPIKAKELDDIEANRSAIMRFGYELDDKKTYRHPREGEAIAPAPAVSEAPAAEPAGISVGSKVKYGTLIRPYIVEEVIPQTAREIEEGDQFYRIRSEQPDKNGKYDIANVEKKDIKPILGKGKGKGARKIAATPAKQLSTSLESGDFASAQAMVDQGFGMDRSTFLRSITPSATQRATTIHTRLEKDGIISKDEFSGGRGLVYGDGRGAASAYLGSQSYEPFPPVGFSPDYTGDRVSGQGDAINKKFNTILNTFVLNVVDPQTRAFIVKDIGNLLQKGGRAVFVTRGADVANSKALVSFGSLERIQRSEGKLTYQKGFTQPELIQYIQETLGEGFTVRALRGGDKSDVRVEVIKNTDTTLDNPQPASPDIRRQAIDTTPEGILTTPPDQQYTFNEVFDVAYDMFGGEIPEGFTIVNDSTDKDFEFKAAYIPESGEIIVNLAYLNKNDDIRDTITHELGHYIFGDPEFRAAFDQFIASLSPKARAELDAYVETAYNKETGEIRLEEKMVRAFVDQFLNEEQAPAWRSMLDAIKRFLNKLGFKFNISDRDAISVFTAALDRYKAGEAISREGGARLMAAEPAPKRRKEQVGGAEREETRYITTPKGILSMNTDVLREKFFDGTSVSPEKTTQAWGYISRLLDIKSGNANEFAGEINDTVDADLVAKREAAIAAGEKVDLEEDVSKRIGAAMFSVELMNYAGRLAEQGDTRMLKFMIRNVNSMPTDKYAGDISDAARALRTRLEYDVSGFSAYTTEQKAKVDRTAAVMFGTGKPSKEQSDAVKDALDESEKTELGNAGEVAGEVEKVEKRTKRKITDKIEKVIGKGSLKGMIQAVKDTPLEKQQERGWIEKVVNDFLINAGLSPEAASTASKLYESLIAERFAAAKQKAFEDNLKKAAPWKNYAARNSRLAKDALNKVQAAIRTGVLDPEKNTESIIAAESGWSGFTKDQYQRIVQLDSIINDPKQDDVTRREAMADLNKVISDAKLPVRFKDALGAYYVGNALMGIPTLTVNIASPIGFTVRNLMTDVSKYAFTDPARIPVAFETFMESMRSWYDQTSYAFKNQIYLNDVVEYLQGQNVLRELFDKGKKQWAEGKYADGFVNMAVGMTQITGRVLSSLDQGAISMLENQNITRYALEALANTKGKVPKDKLKEFANMVIDTRRKTIAENIANGMSRDRAGVLADLAVKSEVISALAQYDVNPMNVLDASINDALQSVGRNKTLTIKGIEQSQKNISDEGFMSYWPIKLLEMVSAGAGREGSSMQIFAKMLYGFALVPARVFHNVAWFSPYGFIRLGVDKYKKNKGEDSPYAMSLQTEAQYRQRLTDSIAGSVAMLGLAALSSASTDEDEDKKFKIVITGNGPSATTDKQYFDSWMKKWKPYSVHIVVNGNIIPINIGRGGEALFFPIMLAGALDDWKIKQKQNLTKKEPEDLSAIAQMLGSSFFALAQRGPYAAFTKPLFDASKDGRVTEELASQAGFFGKTFIPVVGSSLARNISDLFNDPVDRSSIEGAIYANTPVVGPWLGTKALNALGQPIRADDWGDKLYKLGVPVVFSFPKETPMNALNELILKQGSGPTIPTRANAQKRFGDVLTDKEFEAYVREYGRVMSDKMFKSRTKLANMKPADYDDELEKYARGYSIDGIKIKGASDSAVLAVKRMRQ